MRHNFAGTTNRENRSFSLTLCFAPVSLKFARCLSVRPVRFLRVRLSRSTHYRSLGSRRRPSPVRSSHPSERARQLVVINSFPILFPRLSLRLPIFPFILATALAAAEAEAAAAAATTAAAATIRSLVSSFVPSFGYSFAHSPRRSIHLSTRSSIHISSVSREQ